MADFDIDRFVDLSGAVSTDDIDWAVVERVGVTDTEERTLRFMMDIESHTLVYMRDLLAGHTVRDPELTAFLSVWVFEELWHGRAIERFLARAGRPADPGRYEKVTRSSALRELVEAILSHVAAHATPRFIATHMTWGAINERTASAAYVELAERTANPELARLLRRIAGQEQKHFSFYYHQAEKRLRDDRRAQALCRFALKRFWTPVGSGVGHWEELSFVAAHLFAEARGQRRLEEIDEKVRALPGMAWFDLVTQRVNPLVVAYERRHGPAALMAAGRPSALP